MFRSNYPTEGMYSGEDMDQESNDKIYEAMKSYTLILRIFAGFFLVMMILMVGSFVYHIPSQLDDWRDNSGKIFPAAYVALPLEAIILFLFLRFIYKLFLKSHQMMNVIKNREYTFSVGTVTDKNSTRTRGSGTHRTIWINNIPCSDISNFYFDAHLGSPSYIIYINKVAYCFPRDEEPHQNE